MDQSYTWIKVIHGSKLYMDQSYTWIKVIHGSKLYTDQSYTWIKVIHVRWSCYLDTNMFFLKIKPHRDMELSLKQRQMEAMVSQSYLLFPH